MTDPPVAVRARRLGRITLEGGKLEANVVERVLSATLDLSATEASQLTLTLTETPGFELLRSGLFVAGTVKTPGTRLTYGRQRFEIRAVELAPRGAEHVLNVTARNRAASRMAREYGALVRKSLSPTDFARQQARRHGLRFRGQPSAERKVISRRTGQERENTWETLQRLAQELGFWCFEAADVLYFGKPSWLAKHDDEPLYFRWAGAATAGTLDELPTCRHSGDSKRLKAAEVTLNARGEDAEDAVPGDALVLEGVPTYAGRYLVNSVSVPLGTTAPVTIGAATPDDPEPEPPPKPRKKKPEADDNDDPTDTDDDDTDEGEDD